MENNRNLEFEKAFNEFYATNDSKIKAYCYKKYGSINSNIEIDDLVSEVYIKILKYINKYNVGFDHFNSGTLRKTIGNARIDMLRKDAKGRWDKKTKEITIEIVNGDDTFEMVVDDHVSSEELSRYGELFDKLIKRFTDLEQKILHSLHYDGFLGIEVAKLYNKKRSKVSDVNTRFKKLLKDEALKSREII